MKEYYQILIVDDDREDHSILHEYFQNAGIDDKVVYVENGLRAIEFLQNISDDQSLPNLIVLDLNMPILNGSQTLMRIKQSPRFHHIPVIIFSTSENEAEKRRCLNYGAIEYMVKPMTYAEGQTMVKKFISFIH
jgi:CheY-like chemotaxis protein